MTIQAAASIINRAGLKQELQRLETALEPMLEPARQRDSVERRSTESASHRGLLGPLKRWATRPSAQQIRQAEGADINTITILGATMAIAGDMFGEAGLEMPKGLPSSVWQPSSARLSGGPLNRDETIALAKVGNLAARIARDGQQRQFVEPYLYTLAAHGETECDKHFAGAVLSLGGGLPARMQKEFYIASLHVAAQGLQGPLANSLASILPQVSELTALSCGLPTGLLQEIASRDPDPEERRAASAAIEWRRDPRSDWARDPQYKSAFFADIRAQREKGTQVPRASELILQFYRSGSDAKKGS